MGSTESFATTDHILNKRIFVDSSLAGSIQGCKQNTQACHAQTSFLGERECHMPAKRSIQVARWPCNTWRISCWKHLKTIENRSLKPSKSRSPRGRPLGGPGPGGEEKVKPFGFAFGCCSNMFTYVYTNQIHIDPLESFLLFYIRCVSIRTPLSLISRAFKSSIFLWRRCLFFNQTHVCRGSELVLYVTLFNYSG